MILFVLKIAALTISPFSGAQEAVVDLDGKPEDNLRHSCGFHRVVAVAENAQAFVEELKRTNFDPCCLGPDILRALGTNRKPLRGISMGASTGVKFYFGGREFVIFYEKGKLLRVAAFRYTGYSAGLSLPYGVAVTQDLIVGTCKEIDDYSGWFKNVEVGGNTVSFGMSGHLLDRPNATGFGGVVERLKTHVNAQLTGCNSVGLNTGPSTALLGGSVSFYERASPVITIRGDRTRKLQNLFRRAHGEAELPSVPAAPAQGRPRARTDFQAFHGKTCNYNIPAQAWNNASVTESLRNLSHRFPAPATSRPAARPSGSDISGTSEGTPLAP